MSPFFRALIGLVLLYFDYFIIVRCNDKCYHGYIEDSYCFDGPQSFLQYILYPVTTMEFFNNYWDKAPLHVSRDFNRDYYANLNLDQVYNNLLSNVDIRSKDGKFEEVRVIKYDKINMIETDLDPFRLDQYQPFLKTLNGDQIHEILDYHKSLKYDLNQWDAAAFGYLLSHGYTLRFFKTQLFSNSTKDLVEYLSRSTGFASRSNLYITPKKSKAFSIHHDVDDIFIIQVHGQKQWYLYGHSFSYCSKIPAKQNKSINLCESNVVSSFDNPDYRSNVSKYMKQKHINNHFNQYKIDKGDVLYLPRGHLHEANNPFHHSSIHISLGIYSELYVDFLYHFIVNVIQITNMYNNINLIELTVFLRKQTFASDDTLRKYMAYNFIKNDKMLVNDQVINDFNRYFREFLISQNMNDENISNLMMSINVILSNPKTKERLQSSLRRTYKSDTFVSKIISIPMRYRQIRNDYLSE